MAVRASMLAIVVAPCLAAAADGHSETVSMGFACSVVEGRVQLEPGPDQKYAVIGKHEQKTLRVCSGSSGARCRELHIHKFAFDCGGKPVAWVKAASAAVREAPWKATLSNVRMTLHYWPSGPGKSRRLPLGLPREYAPAPISGLRFAPTATLGEPERGPANDLEQLPRVTSLRFERPVALQAAQAASPPPTEVITFSTKGGTGADVPEHALALTSSAKAGWASTAYVSERGWRGSWWSILLPSTVPNILLAGLGLAVLLLTATAVASRQTAAHRTARAQVPATDAPLPDLDLPAGTPDVPPPPSPVRDANYENSTDTVAELASALRAEPVGDTSVDETSIEEMRARANALLGFVRDIVDEHVPEGAVRDVLVADLAVIAARLEGKELSEALAEGRSDFAEAIYSQAILDLERARTLSRIERERALQVVDVQSRSLETVDEACAFLGVNPRASEAVVKKVVDALRQNWHPDLADDESDRQAREERMKQINAAWDLIRAR